MSELRRISLAEAQATCRCLADFARLGRLLDVEELPAEVLLPPRQGLRARLAERIGAANLAILQLVGPLRRLPRPALYRARDDVSLDEVRCSYVSEGGRRASVEVRVRLAGPGGPSIESGPPTAMGLGTFPEATRTPDPETLQELERRFEAVGFEELRADERSGLDGETWVLERLRAGRYHVVFRWSPQPGPLRDLLEFVRGLA